MARSRQKQPPTYRSASEDFDIQAVRKHVAEWVNRRWQKMVDVRRIANEHRETPPVWRREATNATRLLIGQYHAARQKLAGLDSAHCALIRPDEYCRRADLQRDEMMRHPETPADRGTMPFGSGADPNWLFATDIKSNWLNAFFEPQSPTATTMLRGIQTATDHNREAARPGHELLQRLNKSTLEPDWHDGLDLLDDVLVYLQSYLPTAPDRTHPGPFPSDDPLEKRRKRKSSSGNADVFSLVKSALLAHHKYQDGICTEFVPLGVNKLASDLGVSTGRVSDFFREQFTGHKTYARACRDNSRLNAVMKQIAGDIPAYALLGPGGTAWRMRATMKMLTTERSIVQLRPSNAPSFSDGRELWRALVIPCEFGTVRR